MLRTTLFVIARAAVVLAALTSSSFGAPSNMALKASTSITVSPTIQKLDALCKASTGVNYHSHLTIKPTASSGAAEPGIDLDVLVTFQKPNLLNMNVSQAGKSVAQLVSGPKTCMIYDPVGNQYASFDAPSDPSGFQMDIAQKAPPATMQALIVGMQSIWRYTTTFDSLTRAPVAGVKSSTVAATLNGVSVNDVKDSVNDHGTDVTSDVYVNASTNMPVSARAIVHSSAMSAQLQEDYASFQLASAPASDSTFEFTPPAGATLYSPPAPSASGEPQEPPVLADGKAAPDFAVVNSGGKTVHLSDYKGRVIVIDFWATWCGPCQESLPGTNKIAGVYQPKGVKFLPVCSWDDKSAFLGWVAKRKTWNMNFYFDPAGRGDDNIAAKLYSVTGIPTQFVIGKDGKVAWSGVGYEADKSEAQLKQAIDNAFAVAKK